MATLSGGGAPHFRSRLCAFTEVVLESARKVLQIPHAASSRGLPSDGFHAPVVVTDALGGVCARRAARLLDVEGAAAAAPAQRVRLVAPLPEGARSLRLPRASTDEA